MVFEHNGHDNYIGQNDILLEVFLLEHRLKFILLGSVSWLSQGTATQVHTSQTVAQLARSSTAWPVPWYKVQRLGQAQSRYVQRPLV